MAETRYLRKAQAVEYCSDIKEEKEESPLASLQDGPS